MLSMFGIFAVLLAVTGGIVVLVTATFILIKVGGPILAGIGAVLGRIVEFIGGVFSDAARLVGAVIAAIVFIPLALANVVIGRWSAANHYADAFRRELRILGSRAWSIVVRRPLRLLFLEGMLEGVEGRAAEAVRQAPGSEKPRRGGEFPGFEITGSLPAGGSGAKLYIARPDEKTRGRLEGAPDEVVIKSFALAEGSSLPQIVRESRSLDAARRLGLVLAHELDDTRFWYAMPYHPGDNLSVAVRHAHGFSGETGVENEDLQRLLGYAIDLVGTLDRYHRGGMWHKDVKPDNIIVHDGAAHLVDFGLVSSLKSAMTLTTHGTEYFRDPEMVRMALKGVKVHEVNGAKFDIYGAGAVLYFILENTFPGHGGLSRFERRSPEALRMIVRRAMADYAHRYENAAEMLADLEVVAAASDPWSVKPAMLPSMGGQVPPAIARDAAPPAPAPAARVETVSSVRRTPPPPPPAASAARRPEIEVTGWWTGGYAETSPARRRAHEQVSSARRRAAVRRQAVSSRSGGKVSLVLAVLVLGVITALAGILLVGMQEGRMYAEELARTHSVMAQEARLAGLLMEPSSMNARRVIVIDEQGPVDESRTVRLAPEVRGRLSQLGWDVVEDPEIEALIRSVPIAGRTDMDRWTRGEFEVDAIYEIRTAGEPADRAVRVIQYAPDGSNEVVLSVDRGDFEIEIETSPAGTPAPGGAWVDSDGEIVEIRLDGHGSMDRIREMIEGTRHRVEERRGVIETRFVKPGWTTDASYTIVSPHGAIIHAN